MAAGFAVPGVLFLGAVHPDERNFCLPVYRELRKRGYTRFVEVCSGALAMSLVAVNAGWNAKQIEASDVSLFSSILGALLADTPLDELGVRVDGDRVELGGDPVDQAARLLYVQLLARTEAEPPVDYWKNLLTDLRDNADKHQAHIKAKLVPLLDTLGGIQYRPLDVWKHLDEVADDPHAVINSNSPSFKAGFEKFFDTKGRLTWDEPEYGIFDPEVDYKRLADYLTDKAALAIFLEEHQTGGVRDGRRAIYGRPMGGGKVAYLHSNRPEEIFEITGGPKVAPRSSRALEPADMPMIPMDYEVTAKSEIVLRTVQPAVVDYYRELWMHRLSAQPGPGNILLTIDGYVAGVIGLSLDSMTRPYPNGKRSLAFAMMRFAFGAPHNTLRLTRLATMFALQRPTIRMLETPQNAVWISASDGLVTIEYTRHPEAKGLRGLMKQIAREKHPDGFKLIYQAPWKDDLPPVVLDEFLRKEAAWRKASQK